MNNENYMKIAEIIKHCTEDFIFQSEDIQLHRQNIANQLADYFEKTDIRFNREPFLKECGADPPEEDDEGCRHQNVLAIYQGDNIHHHLCTYCGERREERFGINVIDKDGKPI